MNAQGDVIWEARPTSLAVVEEAFAQATKLDELMRKAAIIAALVQKKTDKVLAANIALLDAAGRDQRAAADMEALEAHAAVKGVDAEIAKKFEAWRVDKEIDLAFRSARRDGGKAVYELFKKGRTPSKERMLVFFYGYGSSGAIGAKDAANAKKLVDLFEKEASKNELFKKSAKEDARKMREQIAEFDK